MAVKLTEDTIIGEAGISSERYRSFFRKAIEEGFSPEKYCGNFQYWLNWNNGKTLKEAIESYHLMKIPNSMEGKLAEERFNIISEADKAFIQEFNKEMIALGYDFGGHIGWGYNWVPYMIVWSKVGVKTMQVAARIYVRENSIVLRMYFNKLEKHSNYIANLPAYLKDVFTSEHGNCTYCKTLCNNRKIYTLDGQTYEKCNGMTFEFLRPNMEKLPDYVGLLKEFYVGNKKIM